MLAVLFVALAMPESPDINPPGDILVTLCNETHVRVGFSVTAPAPSGLPVQKGWFNVDPGACLEGRIGETAGGEALVHARSGTWTWPAEDQAVARKPLCVLPESQAGVAHDPPCPGRAREADHARVEMERRGRHYLVEYTVSCADFGAEAGLCRQSPPARDGFAVPVRELEVCNVTDRPAPIGFIEHGEDGTRRVARWEAVAPESCEIVFRGYPQTPSISVITPLDLPEGSYARTSAPVLCTDPAAEPGDLTRRTALSCPEGRQPFALRTADYGPNTSRFSMTVN